MLRAAVGEVREEYRTITGKPRDLGVTQYETLLRRLRSMGLIDTLDSKTIDVHQVEARVHWVAPDLGSEPAQRRAGQHDGEANRVPGRRQPHRRLGCLWK